MRGAFHSVAASVAPGGAEDIFVMLSKMNRVHIDEKAMEVTVEAGCHLDYDPEDPTKISTPTNGLFKRLDKKGFALPDMGGITHQSVGGFLSTGASGSNMTSSFNDALLSVTFIPADQENPQCITVSKTQNPDLFYAIGVSMGLLGIVVKMTFNLIQRFDIEGKEVITKFEDCAVDMSGKNTSKRSLKDFFLHTEFKRILWYPQPKVSKVVVWQAEKMGAPFLKEERKKYVRKPYKTFIVPGFIPVKFVEWIAHAIYYTIGHLPKWLSNWKFFNRWFFNNILPAILKVFVPLDKKDAQGKLESQCFKDYWYSSLPMDNDINDKMVPVWFSEMWIPFDPNAEKDTVAEVMIALNELYADMYAGGTGPIPGGTFAVEFVPTRKSEFWMSPAYQTDVLRVDVFWFGDNAGTPISYYRHYWNKLAKFNFRCHWGKYLPDFNGPQGVDYLKARYPKWDAFMAYRDKYDPEKIFVSQYWQQHLDI